MSRSASVEPMKPATPVTSALITCSLAGAGRPRSRTDRKEHVPAPAGRRRGRGPESGKGGRLQFARGALGIRRVKDRRSGDDEACPGGDDRRDVLASDSAVDFHSGRTADAIEKGANRPHLRLTARNEG